MTTKHPLQSWDEEHPPIRTVTITVKEYQQLIERTNWLDCLEAAGVDNWDGWDYALEIRDANDE